MPIGEGQAEAAGEVLEALEVLDEVGFLWCFHAPLTPFEGHRRDRDSENFRERVVGLEAVPDRTSFSGYQGPAGYRAPRMQSGIRGPLFKRGETAFPACEEGFYDRPPLQPTVIE